jgi:tRNA A37 threonylcarbamoyladenosine modification protein TsaB
MANQQEIVTTALALLEIAAKEYSDLHFSDAVSAVVAARRMHYMTALLQEGKGSTEILVQAAPFLAERLAGLDAVALERLTECFAELTQAVDGGDNSDEVDHDDPKDIAATLVELLIPESMPGYVAKKALE